MSQEHTSEFKVKDIWRVFWVLAGITAIEFVVALAIPETFMPKPFKVGLYLVLTIMKAFYIVAYFMHLKHEIKNLIMTIVVPLALFIWFIAAFLADGNSFRNLRNNYDPHFKEQSTIKVPEKHHAGGESHKATEKHEAGSTEKHEEKAAH